MQKAHKGLSGQTLEKLKRNKISQVGEYREQEVTEKRQQCSRKPCRRVSGVERIPTVLITRCRAFRSGYFLSLLSRR